MVSQVTTQDDRLALVRRLLVADAVLCGAGGLVLVVGAGPVARFTEVNSSPAFRALGAVLVGWAGLVRRIASRLEQDTRPALIVPALNVAWVIAVIGLLAGRWLPLSAGGRWVAGVVNLVVLDLTLLQVYALRRAGRAR